MNLQSLKKRAASGGDLVLGTMVFEFDSTGIARIAATAAADFVLFDMEHTGWSVETIRSLIACAPRDRIVPLVRVPAADYHFIARVLDVGAQGVMVPMVTGREHAESIVLAAKYPPAGRRGGAFGVAHDDYAGGDVVAKMQAANDDILLIAQIETAAGLENAEAIAAVDGLDVLWIGQTDLTNSLGIPGQFDHPEFQNAVQRVVAAAKGHNKSAGYMAASVEEARRLRESGINMLAYSGDIWIYQRALAAGIAAIRETEPTQTC